MEIEIVITAEQLEALRQRAERKANKARLVRVDPQLLLELIACYRVNNS